MAAMGINKVADVNFLVPVLIIALLAIFLSRRVDFINNLVNS